MGKISETEENKYTEYERIYHDLYVTFNDDNESHYESSFYSNHFETADELKTAILDFVNFIISCGCTTEEIIKQIPAVQSILN